MARSVRGRVQHGTLPSWPPLRIRAVVNGLSLILFGAGLLYLAWGLLDFTVYDARRTAMVPRVLAVWLSVGLPVGALSIGLHLVLTAVTASDRLLLSHGAASWDPGEFDDILRGVRIRNWRPRPGGRLGAVSAKTLGWIPVQTPVTLAPLALGALTTVGLMIWLATGYGAAALILLLTLAWIGWRATRAWGALRDFRADRGLRGTQPTAPRDQRPVRASTGVVVTADEAWDDDDGYVHPRRTDPYQREQELRRAMADDGPARTRPAGNDVTVEATQPLDEYFSDGAEDPTAPIPLYRDPAPSRGDSGTTVQPEGRVPSLASSGEEGASREAETSAVRRPLLRRRKAARDNGDEPSQVVLVDRSAERAKQARMRKYGQETAGDSRPERTSRGNGAPVDSGRPGRGRGRGLKDYFGERVTADPTIREPGPDGGRNARRTGAPSKTEAEREIYERRDEASSIFGYVLKRRKND